MASKYTKMGGARHMFICLGTAWGRERCGPGAGRHPVVASSHPPPTPVPWEPRVCHRLTTKVTGSLSLQEQLACGRTLSTC